MRVSHSPQLVSAAFDDPNLVSCAGLAPVVALAHRCGLAELVADTLTLSAKGGVNAHLKVPALIGGMVAGADSIDPAHQRPRPPRSLRSQAPASPPDRLALGTGLDPTVRRDPGTPHHRLNPTHRRKAQPRREVEEPDRPADHPRPTADQDHQAPSRPVKNGSGGSRLSSRRRGRQPPAPK